MVDPIEFPLNNVKRISGAVRTSTDIQDGINGFEVRNANWQDTLRRFDIAHGLKGLDDQRLVHAFFMACNGPEVGFLIKDWMDFDATHDPAFIPNGNGAYTQGVTTVVAGTNGLVYQLGKKYHNGYRYHVRTITRPVAGTLRLFVGGGLVGAGYSFDKDTGRVTFQVAPASAPTADFNFLVPVRFQEDEVPWDVIRYRLSSKTGYGELPEIVAVEVREG